MELSAKLVSVREILPWRDLYRKEMNCQIVHDSLHTREGWTQEYFLEISGQIAGYGSILIGGPWAGTRTAFEFYVLPAQRSRVFDLFACLLAESGADAMKAQTNDALLTAMLHLWARDIKSEKIVFHDRMTTVLPPPDAALHREGSPGGEFFLEIEGAVVATGGIMFHYNRPYADIYMRVEEKFRMRGLGSYLVQELKKACYLGGSIPCARCDPDNIASRKTLQKAGFVPCAHILTGSL